MMIPKRVHPPPLDKLVSSALVELAVHTGWCHQSNVLRGPHTTQSTVIKAEKMLSKGLCLSYIFCLISMPTKLAWKSNATLTNIVAEEMMR